MPALLCRPLEPQLQSFPKVAFVKIVLRRLVSREDGGSLKEF